MDDVDVVVIGAGLAGIGTAARLRRSRPGARIALLEGRDAIGGTWDLFRYPGVRSDSDMFTLGYPFRPWTDARAIAPAETIRDYIRDTADEEGVTPLIRFGHRVRDAEWESATARWTLHGERRVGDGADGADPGATTPFTLRARFVVLCCGYYRYESGHTPELPGLSDFAGDVVHPQLWPEGLEVSGRRVVVIGSGATAVTLVPALAERGAQVTMLQRSPTYVGAVPRVDRVAARLQRTLPPGLAYRGARLRHLVGSSALYRFSRHRPQAMRRILLKAARAKLPATFDVDTHFSPTYDPWDQRLCAAPGGDLFRAISDGSADVVTDRIRRIMRSGIELESGRMLEADVLVTATGLHLQPMGGIRMRVDGEEVRLPERVALRGMMLSGVPNLAFALGYVNASWTLKTDLMARFVVRLLAAMDRRGADAVVPTAADDEAADRPLIDLAAGYLQRGADLLPRQGRRGPWRVRQDYLRDALRFRFGRLGAGLVFRRAADRRSALPQPAAV